MKEATLQNHAPTGLLLTIKEAAAELRLGKDFIYKLIHSGELPVIRCGKSVRISRKAIEVWIETSQSKA